MKQNDLLHEKIRSIQNEYKCILEKIVNNVSEDWISEAILDEINIFWSIRLDIVELYLCNLSSSHDTFAFTGATFLDLAELEHYPLMLLGDMHILDDQIYIYSNIVSRSNKTEFNKRMQKQIFNSINNNLVILSKYYEHILILPVRFSYSKNQDIIKNNANSAFLSLFKEPPASIEDYFATYSSIDDICNGIRNDIQNVLILSDAENFSISFKERLDIALNDKIYSLGNDESIGILFYNLVGGHLCQALDIILSCTKYNISSFLRYSLAYYYVLLLSQNFLESLDMQRMFFKSRLARAIYFNFNYEYFKNIDFEDYCNIVRNSNFYQDLLSAFPVQSIETVSVKETNNVIREKLDLLYSLFTDRKQLV